MMHNSESRLPSGANFPFESNGATIGFSSGVRTEALEHMNAALERLTSVRTQRLRLAPLAGPPAVQILLLSEGFALLAAKGSQYLATDDSNSVSQKALDPCRALEEAIQEVKRQGASVMVGFKFPRQDLDRNAGVELVGNDLTELVEACRSLSRAQPFLSSTLHSKIQQKITDEFGKGVIVGPQYNSDASIAIYPRSDGRIEVRFQVSCRNPGDSVLPLIF